MDDCRHQNALWFNPVDQTIAVHEALSYVGLVQFGNDASGVRKLAQSRSDSKHLLDDSCGIENRIARDIASNVIHVLQRFGRPDYDLISHLPRCSSASACDFAPSTPARSSPRRIFSIT
jgi:hypothetical protein